MNLKIESNIPIPARTYTGGRAMSYPFDELQPGQSVFIPGDEATQRAAISSAASWRKRRGGTLQITTRANQTAVVNGKEVKGARIWRTA